MSNSDIWVIITDAQITKRFLEDIANIPHPTQEFTEVFRDLALLVWERHDDDLIDMYLDEPMLRSLVTLFPKAPLFSSKTGTGHALTPEARTIILDQYGHIMERVKG